MVQYVEGIRELLGDYDEILNSDLTEEGKTDKFAILLNKTSEADKISEVETIVHEIMELTFESLINSLMDTFDDMYGAQITQRITFYIVIICLLLFVFFTMWVPFINGMSSEIWRTKCMLFIITREVVAKMKSVQKFLNDPNIFSAKGDV